MKRKRSKLVEDFLKKKKADAIKAKIGYDTLAQYKSTKLKEAYVDRLHGKSRVWGSDIVLKPKDREHHVHIPGTTGAGKSRFLELNMREDALEGRGFLFLDPTGNLYKRMVNFCALHNLRKVCLFDPMPPVINDDQYYISFNPLRAYQGEEPGFRAGLVADALAVAFGEYATTTTRISHYFPAILKTLICTHHTMLEVPHFFFQSSQRAQAGFDEQVRDAIVRNAFAAKPPQLHSQMPFVRDLDYLYSKGAIEVDKNLQSTAHRLSLLEPDAMHNIFGPGDGINFQDLIEEGWIILVNLDDDLWSGRFEESCAFGSLLLNFVLACHPSERFSVYVDEVGRFGTRKLVNVLAETRQENFAFYLAHQNFAQLRKTLKSALLQNCHNRVVFRMEEAADARELAANLQMPGGEKTLMNLEDQWAAIKIKIEPTAVSQINTVPDLEDADVDAYLASARPEICN